MGLKLSLGSQWQQPFRCPIRDAEFFVLLFASRPFAAAPAQSG
jgi:hypothetical protein